MRHLGSFDEVKAAVGTELGTSEWLVITQERVDQFAAATGDHQWIHVNPQRAALGPFGGTIAHGWLTVSLLPVLVQQIFKVAAKMGVNYGLNRLRFPSPVPVGSLIRAHTRLLDAVDLGGAVQLTVETTIEIQGSDKPALVAETLSRYYW